MTPWSLGIMGIASGMSSWNSHPGTHVLRTGPKRAGVGIYELHTHCRGAAVLSVSNRPPGGLVCFSCGLIVVMRPSENTQPKTATEMPSPKASQWRHRTGSVVWPCWTQI